MPFGNLRGGSDSRISVSSVSASGCASDTGGNGKGGIMLSHCCAGGVSAYDSVQSGGQPAACSGKQCNPAAVSSFQQRPECPDGYLVYGPA